MRTTIPQFSHVVTILVIVATLSLLIPPLSEAELRSHSDDDVIHIPDDLLEDLEKLHVVSAKTLEELHKRLDEIDQEPPSRAFNLPVEYHHRKDPFKKHSVLSREKSQAFITPNVHVHLLKPSLWSVPSSESPFDDESFLGAVYHLIVHNYSPEEVCLRFDTYIVQGETVLQIGNKAEERCINANSTQSVVLVCEDGGPLITKTKELHAVLVRVADVKTNEGSWLRSYNSVQFLKKRNNKH
ncbi:hypothetical protein RCL1_008028 [Eukaryota sp. TZLM3-RCL]